MRWVLCIYTFNKHSTIVIPSNHIFECFFLLPFLCVETEFLTFSKRYNKSCNMNFVLCRFYSITINEGNICL